MASKRRSLMTQWLRRAFRDIKCIVRDLQVMGSNLSWVELGVSSTAV